MRFLFGKRQTVTALGYLLVPGVVVQVKYDPEKHHQVRIDDDIQAVLARNPQLIKKG